MHHQNLRTVCQRRQKPSWIASSSLAFDYNAHHHPPLRTVEDAKAYRGDMPGLHIKEPLFAGSQKAQFFIGSARRPEVIDLKVVQAMIGCDRLSFGSAERLMEMLGVRPGAVSPLALINDPTHKVGVLLDKAV